MKNKTTVKNGIEALRDLQEQIEEIINARSAAPAEENGWQDDDLFQDFHEGMIGDATMALKLVGIGMGMGETLTRLRAKHDRLKTHAPKA